MNMKKLETTYKDFCDLVKNDPSKQYYIKTDKGEFTKIHAVGSKITDSWKIKFSTGYEIIVGDRHAFMSENGEPLFANELTVGDKVKTTNGLLEVTESSFHKSNDMMYDISIDSPHWYVNDENGIIHHNTLFSMLCAKAYLDKYDDAVLIFYDSEMGASKDYFNSLEIDMNRVFHVPITNIEELKFDIMSQLQELKRGDHAIIVIDSIGNLASAKEIDDAINEKSAADMTRAKQLKSLTRMITPYLNILNIPMIMVNHIYMEIGMFPKAITSGGTGPVYASNQIFLISRSQEKKGTDLVGYNFNINIMKSRMTREKARIPVTVTYDGGINKWSGLLDMALCSGHVIKPSNGWYQKVDPETGEVLGNKLRAADTNTEEFWESILSDPSFNKWVNNTFKITAKNLLQDENVKSEVNEEHQAEFTSDLQ